MSLPEKCVLYLDFGDGMTITYNIFPVEITLENDLVPRLSAFAEDDFLPGTMTITFKGQVVMQGQGGKYTVVEGEVPEEWLKAIKAGQKLIEAAGGGE